MPYFRSRLLLVLVLAAIFSGSFSCGGGNSLHVTEQNGSNATLVFVTTVLPSAVLNAPYTATITATGSTTITFAVTSGNLPSGLALSSGGAVTGTPLATGTFNFTVTATGTAPAATGTQSFSIVVDATAKPLVFSTTSLPGGMINVAYNQMINVTGGLTPYTFSVQPANPIPGETFFSDNTQAGLSGTPTTGGTFTFTVKVTDSSPVIQSATQQFTVNISSPLGFSTSSPLSSAITGQAYSASIGLSGGIQPYSFSVSSGVPPGTQLVTVPGASQATLTGFPTAAGTYTFTVQATDSSSTPQNVSQQFTVIVVDPLKISTTNISNGVVGVPLLLPVVITGGTSPHVKTLAPGSGPLPPGLMLTAGQIVGTPTTAGTYNFTLQVTDSSTPVQVVTANLTITITLPTAPVGISTASVPTGLIGQSYSAPINGMGGTGPYQFSKSAGTLPPGLSISQLSATQAQITGTPTTAGPFTFTVQIADSSQPALTATQQFTINVFVPVSVTTTSLANATTGVSYAAALAAAGGTGPYSFSLAGGTLPSGLSLSNGSISGTTTQAGSFNITVQATDSTPGTPLTSTQNLTLIVVQPGALAITTSSVPGGITGQPYAPMAINASGGTAPYTFSLSAGTLPAGLSLSALSGTQAQITGTPTQPGNFTFTVKAVDSNAKQQTATLQYQLTVTTVTINIASNFAVAPKGGFIALTSTVNIGAVTFSGLGVSAGICNAGVCTATFSAANTLGPETITATSNTDPTKTASVKVDVITLSASALQTMPFSAMQNLTVAVNDGTNSPPAIPLSFVATAGSIPGSGTSGTPIVYTSPTAANTYTITATAAANPPITASANVTVVGPIVLGATSLDGITGGPYNNGALNVSGGLAPYTVTLASGSLPPGLTLPAPSGALSLMGVPTTAGKFPFTLQISDSTNTGQAVKNAYNVEIDNPLAITTTTLGSANLNTPFSANLQATGGSGALNWTLANGSPALPAGLSLSTAGVVSGTPTAGGQTTVMVQVSDPSAPADIQQTKSGSVTITVGQLIAKLNVTNATGGIAPVMVQADGTGSTDSNGTIQSYSIDFGDGSPVANSATASHNYLYAGIYPVTLTVVDNNNAMSSTTVSVAINQPSTAAAKTTYVPPVGIPNPSFGIADVAPARPSPWTTPQTLYSYVDPTDINCTDSKQISPFTGTPLVPRCTIPTPGLDGHFPNGLPAGMVVELHTSAKTCMTGGLECSTPRPHGTMWCYATDHQSNDGRRILVQGTPANPVFLRGQDNSTNEPTVCMPNGIALYGSYGILENLKADQSNNVLTNSGDSLLIGVSEQDPSCSNAGCGTISCPNSNQVMCADHIAFRHIEALNSDLTALGNGQVSNDLCTNNNASCPGFEACATLGGGWFGTGNAGDPGILVPAGASQHDIVFWDINLHDQGQMNPRTFAAQNGCSGIQIQRDMSNVWVLYSTIHNLPQNGLTTTGCDGGSCQNDIHHVYFGGNDVSTTSKSCFVAKASHDVIFSQNSCHDVYPTDCDVSVDPLGKNCAPSTGLSMIFGPQNVWFILNSVSHVLWGVNESDPDVGSNTGHYYLGNVFTAISNAYDIGPTGVPTDDEIGFLPSNNSVGNAQEAFRISQAFTDIHIVNNTLDDMTAANGVGEAGGGATFGPNSEIVNNIFANRGTNVGFDIIFEGATAWNNTNIDFNYFFSTQPNFLNVDNLNGAPSPFILAGSTLGGKCPHCLDSGAAPNFVNAASDDTHLTPTSPMRNACMSSPPAYDAFRKLYGLSIATDRDGQARPVNSGWSCGAYN